MTTPQERAELRNLASCCERCMTKTVMVQYRQLLALLDDLAAAEAERGMLIDELVDREEAPFGMGAHPDCWREWLQEEMEERANSK